jgi:hypothetical protein
MAFFTPEFYHQIEWEKFSSFHQLKKIVDGLWIGKVEDQFQFYIVKSTGLSVCIPGELGKELNSFEYTGPHIHRVQEAQRAIRKKNIDAYYLELT